MTKDEISAIQVGKIIQAVETIEDATAKITAVIYDQGGLVERTIKMEQAAERLQKEADAVAEFRVHTSATLDRIETAVASHHSDTNLHSFVGLVLKRNILGGILLAFIIVHSLIPSGVSLWEILKKLAGL